MPRKTYHNDQKKKKKKFEKMLSDILFAQNFNIQISRIFNVFNFKHLKAIIAKNINSDSIKLFRYAFLFPGERTES